MMARSETLHPEGRRYVCSPSPRHESSHWRATALRARQGPSAASGGALRAALTRARAAAWMQLWQRRHSLRCDQRDEV